jgi:RimJ/RimL family protein N-acetyltransferase
VRVAHETSSWEGLRLNTLRLCLRTPTSRDPESLYDLFADPEVMRGLHKLPISMIEEARAMIEQAVRSWTTDGLGPFILETAADRKMSGRRDS